MADRNNAPLDPLTSVLDGWQRQIVDTDNGPVEIAAYGDGPVVLTLHGALGGYDQSAILAKTIGCDGFRYVAVSRPGYLGTPLASGGTSEAQGDLLAALLDALDVDQAAVMVVSGGGPCALQFAQRHGQRCWALILASTCAVPMETEIPWTFNVMRKLARWPAFGNWLERRTVKDPSSVASRSITDPALCQKTLSDVETGPLFRALMQSTYHSMAQRLAGTEVDIVVSHEEAYPLEQISTPTLVIHGTADPLLPFDQHAKAFEGRIPNASLLTLEDGEHAAIFSHRAEVTPAVAAFLRSHAPQATPETA